MLFISHNLAVVRYVADFVAVMYHGRIVEHGPADEVLEPSAAPALPVATPPTLRLADDRRRAAPCHPTATTNPPPTQRSTRPVTRRQRIERPAPTLTLPEPARRLSPDGARSSTSLTARVDAAADKRSRAAALWIPAE